MPENAGSAYLEVEPRAVKNFGPALERQLGGSTRQAGRKAGEAYSSGFSGGLKKLAGLGAGLFAVNRVTGFLKDANAEAREAQKVGGLTTQVIKSTGGAANVTATEVGNLATAISNKVAVDDEAIQSGANLLLTFKNIRNEAGKGNKIFDQATQAATDLGAGMAAASGGQINFRSSATLVGKALNDPIKGLTALRRVGVDFTKGQQDQIKKLVESGKTMRAQKIILRELKSEFGGAAAAQATAGDRARVSWKNLEETIGTALLPVVDKLSNLVADDVVPAITDFVTGMEDGTGAGGQFVDVLTETYNISKGIVQFFDSLPGPVKKYGLELVIAAVALNKINNGLTSGRTALGNWTSGLATAEGQTTRTARASYALGVGLRNLAGAGGMIAVAHGAQESNKALGVLETTLGGAATGFAVGGPFGAAVGGTVGLFGSMIKAMNETTTVTNKRLHPATQAYIDTLNVGTHAMTGYTKALVVKNATESGAIEAGRKLGISSQTVVKAILGNAKAQAVVAAAQKRADEGLNHQIITYDKYGNVVSVVDKTTKAQRDAAHAAFVLGSAVASNVNQLKADIIKKNEAVLATGKYSKVLAGVPRNVQTRVDQLGLAKADQSITRLTAKYHLTPKQVETILRAAGERPTAASIQHVIDKAQEYGRLHPKATLEANTKPARDAVSSLVTDIHNLLSGNFTALVSANVTHPKARATGGPVAAGQPYVVGERRPELFVPNQSGRIIPQVPTATTGSGVDHEQASYRAFTRALRDAGMVVVSRETLSAADLAGAV